MKEKSIRHYKLVTQDYTTQNNTIWLLPDGERPIIKAVGKGNEMCTDGVIHSYASPELAAFLNIIHANINNPRLLAINAGPLVADDGLKGGHKWARMVEELPMPCPTTTQRVRFAILCVLAIPNRKLISTWDSWAIEFLKNPRDAANAADAAYSAYSAYAAYAAANAADAANAAYAAAYSANAAYAAYAAANAAARAAHAAHAANAAAHAANAAAHAAHAANAAAHAANAAAHAAHAAHAAADACPIDFVSIAKQAMGQV